VPEIPGIDFSNTGNLIFRFYNSFVQRNTRGNKQGGTDRHMEGARGRDSHQL
jgi:hypothetical protein